MPELKIYRGKLPRTFNGLPATGLGKSEIPFALVQFSFGGDSVSLWKAASLTPLGTFATGDGTIPIGACSDGLNFWITLSGSNMLARF